MNQPIATYLAVDRLSVEIHPDRAALGRAAARAAAAYLRDVLAQQGEARVIFGRAPSQNGLCIRCSIL